MDLEPEGIVSKIITRYNLDQKTTERYVSDILGIRFATNDGGLMDQNQLWKKTVEFHGHECPGLMIGVRASLYVARLLGLHFSEDEEVVCIAENDSCSIDAIQVILGCTAGKGNLHLHLRGKQAFSFYNRKSGESVRLVLKPKPKGMSREESMAYYRDHPDEELFEVMKTRLQVPPLAKIFESYTCEICGESTGAKWIRILDGKKVCLDCYEGKCV